MLTNSPAGNKPGPKETDAGTLHVFAHQAYWGFRFLAQKRQELWEKILLAETSKQVREVGKKCAQPGVMTGAGYGAAGAMTYLQDGKVALQVLSAKHHRRYPKSDRPTSEDRRMIFLGVAVAAGIFELTIGTALRKLAESNLGIEVLSNEVHTFDQYKEMVEKGGYVMAEPVTNYLLPLSKKKFFVKGDLPCDIPADCAGGYIIHGYLNGRPLAKFSRTLPTELANSPEAQYKEVKKLRTMRPTVVAQVTHAPNQVVCKCGAYIVGPTRRAALQVLAEHKRVVHGRKKQTSRTWVIKLS